MVAFQRLAVEDLLDPYLSFPEATRKAPDTAAFVLACNCSPLLGQNPVTSPMPAGPVAGKRVGRHGAIEPSR